MKNTHLKKNLQECNQHSGRIKQMYSLLIDYFSSRVIHNVILHEKHDKIK